jgi:hypothetical protein
MMLHTAAALAGSALVMLHSADAHAQIVSAIRSSNGCAPGKRLAQPFLYTAAMLMHRVPSRQKAVCFAPQAFPSNVQSEYIQGWLSAEPWGPEPPWLPGVSVTYSTQPCKNASYTAPCCCSFINTKYIQNLCRPKHLLAWCMCS